MNLSIISAVFWAIGTGIWFCTTWMAIAERFAPWSIAWRVGATLFWLLMTVLYTLIALGVV